MEQPDPRLSFEVTFIPTAEQFAEARRWIRYFRLGRKGGIFGIGFIAIYAMFIFGGGIVALFQEGIEGLAQIGLGLLISLIPLGIWIRAWTVRGRHIVDEWIRPTTVTFDPLGVTVLTKEERRHWMWDETTWLQGLKTVWVLSTWKEHLVIPRSAANAIEQFEPRIWEHLRKQSAQRAFEIVPTQSITPTVQQFPPPIGERTPTP